jgi:hypothetical protein
LSRPRLLLFPLVTELEWVIRPELEQWADVATFDLPGVGAEPPVERLDRRVIIDRSLLELDRRGWDSYILVADAPALPTAVWEINLRDSEPFGDLIREVGVPLLFAKHEGCLGHTDEGFEEAVTAFPEARAVSVPTAPSVSEEFAEALRQFCADIARPTRRTDE